MVDAEERARRYLVQQDFGDAVLDDDVKALADILRAVAREEREACAKALAANERDRSAVARAFNAINAALEAYGWLEESGRGAYEWDDDRWVREFADAMAAVRAAAEPLRKIAGDLTDCPATQAGAKPVPGSTPTFRWASDPPRATSTALYAATRAGQAPRVSPPSRLRPGAPL